MSKFDWYDKGHAQLALEVGIISPSDFAGFIIYKRFLDIMPTSKNKTEAINNLTEEFKTSYSSVFRAIQSFE